MGQRNPFGNLDLRVGDSISIGIFGIISFIFFFFLSKCVRIRTGYPVFTELESNHELYKESLLYALMPSD